MSKRHLEICVISDVHLGTPECYSRELLVYLQSIEPETLILNGDIIDGVHFRKDSMPPAHWEVIHHINKMAGQGTRVFYITGNQDDGYSGELPLGGPGIQIRNQLELLVDHKRYWILHGDIFEPAFMLPAGMVKMAGMLYKCYLRTKKAISLFGRLFFRPVNRLRKLHQFRNSLQYTRNFERLVCRQANSKHFDYVICGHIHVPMIRKDEESNLIYMNAGDWTEHLTALEYRANRWELHQFDEADYAPVSPRLQPVWQDRTLRSRGRISLTGWIAI